MSQTCSKLALNLPNEVREINRVLYTPGSILTLEDCLSLTPTFMDHHSIRQAQSADFAMRQIADQHGYNDSRKCSQMPGILIPCNFGREGNRSLVVRPCWTHDFMAIIGMMLTRGSKAHDEEHIPADMFLQMAKYIPKAVDGISRVILDATDKPPASTEWE